MKHRLWIAVGLMLMEPALMAAPLSYSEDFNSWGDTWLELSPSATTDYWYRDSGALVGGVVWGGGRCRWQQMDVGRVRQLGSAGF